APAPELKAVQRRIAKKLLQTHPLHDACNGYRAGKSIVSNAVPHLDKDFVLNIDIKDFFTTISSKRVLGLFCSMGYSEETSYLLARLCTREGALPQGAPSSPDIANLICRRMDHRLSQFCKRREWHYTRYCDDITISGAGSPHASLGTICDIIR